MSNSKYNWHILEVAYNRADSDVMAIGACTLESSSLLSVLLPATRLFISLAVTRSWILYSGVNFFWGLAGYNCNYGISP